MQMCLIMDDLKGENCSTQKEMQTMYFNEFESYLALVKDVQLICWNRKFLFKCFFEGHLTAFDQQVNLKPGIYDMFECSTVKNIKF